MEGGIVMANIKWNDETRKALSRRTGVKKYRVKKVNDSNVSKRASQALDQTAVRSGKKEFKVYVRKTKKTGSSIQATIPSEFANQLNLKPGDNVVYRQNRKGQIVIEKEQNVSDELGVGEDFIRALSRGMAEYDEALKDLVER